MRRRNRLCQPRHDIRFHSHNRRDAFNRTVLAGTHRSAYSAAMSTSYSPPKPSVEAERNAAEPFLRALFAARNRLDWAETIAQNGVSLLGHGRVSVLTSENGTWHVAAITGTTSFVREAEAIRRIESFVTQASASFPSPVLIDLTPRRLGPSGPSSPPSPSDLPNNPISQTESPSTEAADSRHGVAGHILAWFAATGVRQLRLCPLQSADSQTSACICIEIFESTGPPTAPPPTESMVQLIASGAEQSMHQLLAASDSGLVSKLKTSAFLKTRARVGMSVVVISLLLLWLFPANFEIEVSGQLFPTNRRRVFAPDDGIVDAVLVRSDHVVKAGKVLIRLRNPERDLELNGILGELDTTQARLAAVRASRNSGGSQAGNSGSDAIRAADLSGEELQLQQRMTTLQAEQVLTEQRLSALSITAPIDGVVYQRQLHERLEARPVQRGQLLLELLQPSGRWQIELLIPDDLIGYVTEANRVVTSVDGKDTGSSRGLRVRFTIPAAGGDEHKATLRQIDSASYIVNGVLVCPATADADSIDTDQCRPGTAVTARIRCGRRSLGFVWFRELIEFWQRKRFSWSPY